MIRAGAKIEGVPQLLRSMKETHEDIHRAVKKGIDRTAYAVESDAKKKLKSDKHIITGRLMGSIHAELKENQQFSYVDRNGRQYDGSLGEEIGEMEAIAGTNVEYAPYIEFGTKRFSGDSFLGWAALRQGKLIVQRILQELSKIRT